MPQAWTDSRLDDLNHKVDRIDRRVDDLGRHMDARFDAQQQGMNARFDAQQQAMDARFNSMESRFQSLQRTLFQAAVAMCIAFLSSGAAIVATQL